MRTGSPASSFAWIVGQRGQPALREVVHEHRSGEGRLQVVEVEEAERRAGAVAELLDHDVDRLRDPRHHRGARLHARLAVVVEQHVCVCVGKLEPPLLRCLGRVVDRDRRRRRPAARATRGRTARAMPARSASSPAVTGPAPASACRDRDGSRARRSPAPSSQDTRGTVPPQMPRLGRGRIRSARSPALPGPFVVVLPAP